MTNQRGAREPGGQSLLTGAVERLVGSGGYSGAGFVYVDEGGG